MKTSQLLLKNRTILHTLFTICDITDVPNKLKNTYDRVDWDFVCTALQKFENWEKFIHMIKVAFTKIQSRTKINGFLSEPLTFMSGVRQGCPLLMMLYIIPAEILPNFIDMD